MSSGWGTCRVCGCTDDRACPGGCWWVEPDLCSMCVRAARGMGDAALAIAAITGERADDILMRCIERAWRELGAPPISDELAALGRDYCIDFTNARPAQQPERP